MRLFPARRGCLAEPPRSAKPDGVRLFVTSVSLLRYNRIYRLLRFS
jgi:hypothetical protein